MYLVLSFFFFHLLLSKQKATMLIRKTPSIYHYHNPRSLSKLKRFSSKKLSTNSNTLCSGHFSNRKASSIHKGGKNIRRYHHAAPFRQTRVTISTLTSSSNSSCATTKHSSISTFKNKDMLQLVCPPEEQDPICDDHIFHTQSLLFLFGFLFFPCWWVGGYFLKAEDIFCESLTDNDDLEKNDIYLMTVHSSLLANGKASSKVFQFPFSNSSQALGNLSRYQSSNYRALFYKWNRIMSIVSIGLVMVIISLFLWYFVQY
ncbi:MAG: hypothetical protein EXX96DRAFT_260437 [Benjaminiella poitrasii]|nr:MAG: hypothetical protein EXX96DRAFT_260437 [Benjaminiella poitrasii]